MLNTKLGLISIGALGTLAIGGISYAVIANTGNKPTTEATMVSAEETFAAPVEEVVSQDQPQEVSLITVANPYATESQDVTMFTAAEGDATAPLTSVTYLDIRGPELVLPSPSAWTNIGLDLVSLESGQTMKVVYVYKFHTDGAVSWQLGSNTASDRGKWNPHPEVIPVTTGQSLKVTYSSTDGGKTWTGDVAPIA